MTGSSHTDLNAIVSSRCAAKQFRERNETNFLATTPTGNINRLWRGDKRGNSAEGNKHGVRASRGSGMRDLTHISSRTPKNALGPPPAAPEPARLSLNQVPERERAGVYREFFGRSVMRLDVEPLRDFPFEVDITVQALPGLHLFSGRVHGSRNRRTREMLADGNDDVGLMINLAGPYLITQGSREIVLGDGDATFMSCAEPCSFTHRPPGDVLVTRVPRATFASLVTGIDDCCLRRMPSGSPAVKLLTDYVKIARETQRLADRELQHIFVAHVHDLMAVAVGATRDAAAMAQDRGIRAARLHAIKQDIGRNLGQPDLSVAMLAARHHCTPRYVQRLFETAGTTLTEYVLAQRLARAHRALSDPRRGREKIAAIAYDCGFGDVSYFNRVFRRHYGVAPSDLRARALRDASDSLM
jgi:AraC-like DNA-binding protein